MIATVKIEVYGGVADYEYVCRCGHQVDDPQTTTLCKGCGVELILPEVELIDHDNEHR